VQEHRLVGLFFAALMGFALGGSFVWGWNFPPTHVDRASHAHKELHSGQSTQPTQSKPEGTAGSPFFVQVLPSVKPSEERAQEEDDRQEKKEADRALVRWTQGLFLATVALVLATIVLGYFGYRQSKDTKESIGIARRALTDWKPHSLAFKYPSQVSVRTG
jgi:hypothetical protein